MRRVLSHIMLLIMLVISIQPTLAMHFCGDSLFSVSLPQPTHEKHTCGSNCGDNTSSEAETFNSLPCCSIENIQVKTDTYQSTNLKADLSLERSIVMELIPIYFSYIYEPLVWDDSSLQALHKFPPRGLGQYTFDLLKNICIYRL